MTLTLLAFRSAITPSRRAVSLAVRLEVGSSMMTSRASSDSALAISTSWRCARDRFATGVAGPKSAPRRRSRGVTFSWSALVSTSCSGPP